MPERFFNNAGPNQPDIHYTLPPLSRWNLDEIMTLIDARRYFILHAPRQTGKTSCMLALEAKLNAEGKYRCLYVNIETAQAARENVEMGMGAIISAYASRARMGSLKDERPTQWLDETWNPSRAGEWLKVMLERHAAADPKPLVVLFDEVDAMIGDTLISFLRQLRAGYTNRPEAFPQALVLCGLRDVRDYRIHSKHTQEIVTGGSAFNIKAESLRLANFTRKDLDDLYAMHTRETGQDITAEARDLAWHYSEGQPWLVNALADTAVRTMVENRDRSIPITGEIMREAAERLIQSRAAHIDQLADKLSEDRVRRVIEPIVANANDDMSRLNDDDLQYVLDLGLISLKPLRIANALYREVIPRELNYHTQVALLKEQPPFVRADQSLDLMLLLRDFQHFFREQGESWADRYKWKESGPQLILQAFLQRIINGDGRVEREYGLGRGRTDLLVSWPKGPGVDAARYATWQKEVIEVKVVSSMGEKFWDTALAQTSEYADRCAAQKAHLIIFDKREGRTWDERIFEQMKLGPTGREITVWGM